MARPIQELDNTSESYYRPSRRRRRHRPYYYRDTGSATSYREIDAPDVEELRRARTQYYSGLSEERRRRRRAENTTRRLTEEVDHSLPSELGSGQRGAGSGGERPYYREDETRRRSRRYEDDGDESDTYVYSKERRRRELDSPPHYVIPEPRPPKAAPERVRVVRSKSTREIVRERPRRVDKPIRETERDEPRRPERSATVRRQVVGRSASVREHDHPRISRPTVRRSATMARRVSASVVESGRPPPRPPSISGKTTVSATHGRAHNPRASIFSLFIPPPPVHHKPEKLVDCVVCMADDIPSSKAAKLECGHSMCQACLKRQFTLSVTDPQHMPPRCCTADHIPLKHVERLLSEKFKRLWNKKYEEYMTKNRLYCPTKGCGAWIKPSHIRIDPSAGRKYGKCSKCGTKVCVLCNGKWHLRRDCPKDEELKQFVDMAKAEGWQRCYNCKAMVELKEGCYHMTCRCTAQFCMLCGLKWKTCDCPWFATPPLDPGDRLLNMNIAQPFQVIFDAIQGRRQQQTLQPPLPPPPLPYEEPFYGGVPPPPVQTGTSRLQRRNTRRQQERRERADELLARRLQDELHIDDVPSRGESADVEVYGLGNAGRHHMNETYVVRAIPPSPMLVSTPVRQSQIFGSRASPRRSSGARLSQGRSSDGNSGTSTPKSSTMAGLAHDGSRRGAARVGTWLQYVEHDPAEVEGRNIIEPSY